MKRSLFFKLAISFGFFVASCKTEKKNLPSPLFNEEETKFLSETVGQILFGTLENYSPYYDFTLVMNTLEEIQQGKKEPLSRNAAQTAMLEFRERIAEKKASINLAEANAFLLGLDQKKGVKEILKGKVYYEILHEGTGPGLSEEAILTVHFTETDLSNHKKRDSRQKDQPVKIKLEETLLGFQKGVIGMRKEERRKIYIHPDLADGKFGGNRLAIFDVEVLEIE